MSPVAFAQTSGLRDVFEALTSDESQAEASSPESLTLLSVRQRVRQQVLDDRISLVFDLLGAGMTVEGKQHWLAQPNPFLDERRPVDLLAAGRFDEVWGAAESYLVGDFV